MADPIYNIVIGGDASKAMAALNATRTTGEQALRTITRGAGEAARGLALAQQEAQGLGRQIAATRAPSNELIANFTRSRSAVNAFKDALNQQRVALSQQRAELAANARALTDVFRASEKAASIQSQVTSLRALGAFLPARTEFSALKTEIDGVASAGVSAGGGLSVLNSKLIGAVGAAVGLRQAVAAIGDVTRTALDFQKLNVQLKFANNGDVKAAADDMKFAADLANRLGLELIATSLSWGKFSSAARGTALEGEKARQVFTSITQAAAVMGLTTADTEGVLLAVTQIMSKGTVSAEELRGQLGERLPGAFNIAARAMGVTTSELGKMLQAGTLLSEDFLPKFAAELQSTFEGSLPEAENTLRAQLGRIENQFSEFKLQLANSGVLDAISTQIDILLQKLSKAAEDGSLQSFAQTLGNSIGELIDLLGTIINLTTQFATALSNLGPAFNAVATGAGAIAIGKMFGLLKPGAESIKLAAEGIGLLDGKLAGLVSRVPQLAVIGFTITKVAELIAAISKGSSEKDALDGARQQFEEEQQRILRNYAFSASVVRLEASQVQKLTEIEKQNYEKRLSEAESFYRAKVSLSKVQPNGPVPQEVIAAQHEARLYAEALKDLKKVQGDRVTAEAAHAKSVKDIKDKELADIKSNLSSLVKAYDDANKALEKANKERQRIAQANADFIAGIGAQKQTQTEQPNLIDVGAQTAAARQSLVKGDFADAINAAERAKKIITQIDSAGTESTEALRGMAKEIAKIQDQAAAGNEQKAQQDIDGIRASIQDLVQRAEVLKKIEIGFDQEKATKSADDLRKELEERLAKTPLQIPAVVVPAQGANNTDPRVGGLLDDAPKKAAGGLIAGPGTDTSDNLLAWLSPGEYVLRAAAVRHYGPELLAALNHLRMPKFATGGLVPQRSFMPLPAAPSSPPASGDAGTPLVIQLGDRRYNARTDNNTARALQRDLGWESMKRGA